MRVSPRKKRKEKETQHHIAVLFQQKKKRHFFRSHVIMFATTMNLCLSFKPRVAFISRARLETNKFNQKHSNRQFRQRVRDNETVT